MAFFTQVEKAILKFVWNHKGHQITKAILKRKDKAGNTTLYALQSNSNKNSMVQAR